MTTDGRLCLLYFGGLSFDFGLSAVWREGVEQKLERNPVGLAVLCSPVSPKCFSVSTSASVVWLSDTQQRLAKNPMTRAVFRVRCN